ncbi:hypothetical protein ACP3TD_00960 [Pseudarthrobacter sp. 1G09]|uniref:hypothetical protein n=1 Tax=Pseudarthrobacter sp. 1G09 TaxID=3416178 RepID=UPI003CED6763
MKLDTDLKAHQKTKVRARLCAENGMNVDDSACIALDCPEQTGSLSATQSVLWSAPCPMIRQLPFPDIGEAAMAL